MCSADAVDAVDAADAGENVVKSVPKLTTPHDCFPLFLLNPIKRSLCGSSITAIKQRQPVVCVDIAGLFQTCGGLEGNYIFPGVGTILSIDRSSDQCLDSFDIDAAAIVLVRHRRQGL